MTGWQSEYIWKQGSREENEDSFSLQQVRLGRKAFVFAVVSDGIGSLQEGETASGWAAEGMTRWFYETGMDLLFRRASERNIQKSLCLALEETAARLGNYGNRKEIRCGAAVTVCLGDSRRYWLAHVGDCRAYRIPKRGLASLNGRKKQGRKEASLFERIKQPEPDWERLTRDHVSADGKLCRAVGTMAFQQPDLIRGRWKTGEALVLCTDGYYKEKKGDNTTALYLQKRRELFWSRDRKTGKSR